MNKGALRIIALILLVFSGLTGLWGGYMLIRDPTGDSLKLPIEYIEATPFGDYLIPGIILLGGIGILNVIVAVFVLKRMKNYPSYIIAQGVILFIWLSTELVMNIEFFYPPAHITYYLIAGLLVLTGWQIKIKQAVGDHERTGLDEHT